MTHDGSPIDPVDFGVTAFFADIISEGNFLRHDSDALAEALFRIREQPGRGH